MYDPLISIIIPSLNQGKFIRQTLDSIFSQEYPKIEVIVMDGGSTDQTIRILKNAKYQMINDKYRKKFRFIWVSEKDRGQADAINKGLRMAKGEIVTYVNSDDYYEPHAIRKIIDYFTANPRSVCITGDYKIVNDKGIVIQTPVRWYKKFFRSFPLGVILPVLNPIAQPSTFWRKHIMKEIGYFDASLHYVFDYDYWMRTIEKYEITVVCDILSSFRIHEASKGSTAFKKQFAEELIVVKRFIHNPLILFLHKVHNSLIIWVYNVIKGYA